VAFVTALAVAQPTPATTGWPQDGYDSGHSNANTQEWRLRRDNVDELGLLWSRSVRPPGITPADFLFEGVSVPVVRGAVFASWLGSEVDAPRLSALDPRTGRVRWARASDWRVVAASTDTAFANASGRVVALDVGSGERRWARWGLEVFAASAAIDRLFVRIGDGVGAIDAATGHDVWVRDDVNMRDGLVSDGTVVVATPRLRPAEALVGLDAVTGETIWRQAIRWRNTRWVAPVAAAGGLIYVVSWPRSDEGNTIRALRPEDGSIVWRRAFGDHVSVGPAGGGRLFVTRSRCARSEGCDPGADWWPLRGALLALDARDGHTLWAVSGETESRRSLWTSHALANGLVSVSATRLPFRFRSRVAVLSAATGRTLWADGVRGTLLSMSAVADGTVYATAAQGVIGGRVRAYGLEGG
jgi:outer membrane protein assembly factor BamB